MVTSLRIVTHSLQKKRCVGLLAVGSRALACQRGFAVRASASGQASMAQGARGAFLLFEGVDKSGKSTQCRRLVEYLNGDQVSPSVTFSAVSYCPCYLSIIFESSKKTLPSSTCKAAQWLSSTLQEATPPLDKPHNQHQYLCPLGTSYRLLCCSQVRPLLPGPVELLRFPDREDQATGRLISQYLKKELELDPVAVHLLFAANRHAVRFASRSMSNSRTLVLLMCDIGKGSLTS